ncbi:MAG TPA: adenylate/guanylate cyclase domain-containing protein [Dehalococcoidia bacterium]|nr:adenylate/guanylate cyclase domain-containing protein [Dehalococcoidia bacterium]
MRSWRKRRFLAGLAIGICFGAILCAGFWFNLLSDVQLQSSDFLFKVGNARQGAESAERVVIVGIDDRSLAEIGHFSFWPRSLHAELIDILSEAEARVIIFDVLFSEQAPGDEKLTSSIDNAGNVILPIVYSPIQQNFIGAGGTTDTGGFLRPLSCFEEGAAALGHANMLPDEDGVIRRLPVFIQSDGKQEPALALAAVSVYLRRPQIIESPVVNKQLSLAGRTIPLDDSNAMTINYTAGFDKKEALSNFKTVSFIDVVNGHIDTSIFNDSIVIVGATAAGLEDDFWTPTGRMMSGVELHAYAINTILSADFLKSASPGTTIAVIILFTLVCSWIVLRFRVLYATLFCTVIFVAYLLISFTAFDRGLMLNMVYPPLAIVGSFVVVNLHNIASERTEKGQIKKTFGRYISTPVVNEILKTMDKGGLKLGGELREVTVMFADVRGFTSLSEEIQPEELVRVLNIYLSAVIKSVLKYDGTVNKFGGDNIMAIWNVPTACDSHALMATKAAMEAQRAIRELRDNDTTLTKMEFSMGINTGRAVAGNLGSEDRVEYSVVGDAVNVASRLTAAAEGGKVWIGFRTYELTKDQIVVEQLEPLQVKGKRGPVRSYEVINIFEEQRGA